MKYKLRDLWWLLGLPVLFVFSSLAVGNYNFTLLYPFFGIIIGIVFEIIGIQSYIRQKTEDNDLNDSFSLATSSTYPEGLPFVYLAWPFIFILKHFLGGKEGNEAKTAGLTFGFIGVFIIVACLFWGLKIMQLI